LKARRVETAWQHGHRWRDFARAIVPAAALFPWKGEKDGDRPRDLFGPGAERIYELAEVRGLEAQRSRGARREIAQRQAARRPAKPAPASAKRQ